LVQGAPEESQVSERDEQTKRFEELINQKQYKEIAKLGEKMSDEELLKCLCQVVTSLDQFKGLYEYLEQREMVPGFRVHGNMVVVREVIAGTNLLKTDKFDYCDSLYDAITLSLKGDRHERVAGLLEAAYERFTWKIQFYFLVRGFFTRYSPGKNSMPLRRFLTLHGEEFSKKHPAIFNTFCEILVERLKCGLDNLDSQKLLNDLVGQPSLLTPVAFARGFLYYLVDVDRISFIRYGYKEAIEEGLRKGYDGGGKDLWGAVVRMLPNQFSGRYPSTDGARTAVLENFEPTKQDREEAWAARNAPSFLPKLVTKLQDHNIFILLPSALWNIVVEYAATSATWVDVEDTAPPSPVPDSIMHFDPNSDSEPDSD